MTSLSISITIASPINTWQYSISCIYLTLIPASFMAHEQHEVKSTQGLLRHNSWATLPPPLIPLLSQPWFPSPLIDLIRKVPHVLRALILSNPALHSLIALYLQPYHRMANISVFTEFSSPQDLWQTAPPAPRHLLSSETSYLWQRCPGTWTLGGHC